MSRLCSTRTETGNERGFTLVELMVVLVVIGITSAAVLFAFPDPGGRLRDDAERFAARARAARDAAVVEARPVAVTITAQGYGFAQRERRQWVPMRARVFDDARWSAGTVAEVGGQRRIVFDTTGLAEPGELMLVRDGERQLVRIGADGAVRVEG